MFWFELHFTNVIWATGDQHDEGERDGESDDSNWQYSRGVYPKRLHLHSIHYMKRWTNMWNGTPRLFAFVSHQIDRYRIIFAFSSQHSSIGPIDSIASPLLLWHWSAVERPHASKYSFCFCHCFTFFKFLICFVCHWFKVDKCVRVYTCTLNCRQSAPSPMVL